jgi:hypothetical protein
MIYLLDADTLIKADKLYYPLERFPIFWDWLRYQGSIGNIKIPIEQYEEIIAGNGSLVDWLRDEETKAALVLDEEADRQIVSRVILQGYAADLDDAELVTVGRDPFLISYAVQRDRCVVSFETSAPAKVRANRKVPDVCDQFGVRCVTLFALIQELDFTTGWQQPGE